jgi:hypothetical protein
MTNSHTAQDEGALFEGGPPDGLQRWLGIIREANPRVVLRAALVILIAWVPPALLSLAHGDLFSQPAAPGFLADIPTHARFLVAAPLLVLAEALCLPRLTKLAWQFLARGIVVESDYPAFQRIIQSTRRLMNATAIEILAVLVAYLFVGTLVLNRPPQHELARWLGTVQAGHLAIAPAGWWALLVSLPLLVILLLGWLWRLILWTRFLWQVSQLHLRLIPAHPDAAAGLGFVAHSLRAFAPLGLVIGVLATGPILERVVKEGVSPLQFKFTALGTVVAVVVIFVLPLLVFMPRLLAERRRGSSHYGALATAMGREFESKWLASREALGADALEASDFSSTTDLYAVVANVYAMRVVPLELKDVALPALAALAPFIPVALLAAPLDVILSKLAGLFL